MKVYSTPAFVEDVESLNPSEQYEIMHAFEKAQDYSKSQLLNSGDLQAVRVEDESMYVFHAGDKEIYCVTGAQQEGVDDAHLVFVKLSGRHNKW